MLALPRDSHIAFDHPTFYVWKYAAYWQVNINTAILPCTNLQIYQMRMPSWICNAQPILETLFLKYGKLQSHLDQMHPISTEIHSVSRRSTRRRRKPWTIKSCKLQIAIAFQARILSFTDLTRLGEEIQIQGKLTTRTATWDQKLVKFTFKYRPIGTSYMLNPGILSLWPCV